MDPVIITTAKLIKEELQKIGKLPPAIYPIDGTTTFELISRNYPTDTEYRIVCYERADLVRERLKGDVHNKQIIVLETLGDIGESVLAGIKYTDSSIVINFGDTIVQDVVLEGDALIYAEDYISDKWTFFKEKNGTFTWISDKKPSDSPDKAPLFVGLFRIENAQFFKECLLHAKHNDLGIDSFYYALYEYSQKNPLSMTKADAWLDIGHSLGYSKSKMSVKSREFNHITIDNNRAILRKTSEHKSKLIDEIEWYLKIPREIEYMRPRIFFYSLDYNAPFVEMEYYSYHTLHELFLYGDLDSAQWIEVFSKIKLICSDMEKYHVIDESRIRASLVEMYVDKTMKRMEDMRKDVTFANYFNSNIVINGNKYCSLNQLEEILKKEIPMRLLQLEQFNIIHGDLCFPNILIDDELSIIKVIDPRGSFGRYDIYGDRRYELAKLLHSVDGKYDFIIKNKFKLTVNRHGHIEYSISCPRSCFDVERCFYNVFSDWIGLEKDEIVLIEGLLFLTMIPLHSEDKDHQLVMLSTAIEIINRVIAIEVK